MFFRTMKKKKSAKLLAFRLSLIASFLFLISCQQSQPTFSAYVEGNLRYLSSAQAGELIALNVSRGQAVKAGQILFKIDSQPYLAQQQAAQAAVAQAQAQLKNALTGQRPPELSQIKSRIEQAQAQLSYADKQVKRYRQLVKSDAITQQQFDEAKRNAEVSLQQLKNLQAQLATAQLPERDQLINADKAALRQAQSNLRAAQWKLDQTIVTAPSTGEIFDYYYHVGEQVPARQPVVSLLIAGEERIVFYVPEKLLTRLKIGQKIHFQADDDKTHGQAMIKFISPQAEYTPPVIYSRHSQQKLVYRVEAAFIDNHAASQWHPGQLLTVIVNHDTAADHD